MIESHLRGLCAGLLLFTGLGLAPAAALARVDKPFMGKVTAKTFSFRGKVIGVDGAPANPFDFAILTKPGHVIEFRVVASTRFHALSAEAEVQGFLSGDYALVTATRMNKDWVAINVSYDVAPPPPLRTVTGVVARVSPDNSRFEVHLDNGVNRWFPIAPSVRIKVNGIPGGPAGIVKGAAVAVTLEKLDRDWVVVEIDVLPPGHPFGL